MVKCLVIKYEFYTLVYHAKTYLFMSCSHVGERAAFHTRGF